MGLFQLSSAEMEQKLKEYEGLKKNLMHRADRKKKISEEIF